MIFHLKIAEASKNTVLNSLMLIITPDILTYFTENNVCSGDKPKTALKEHIVILDHIRAGEAEFAAQAMRQHLDDILNYSQKTQK